MKYWHGYKRSKRTEYIYIHTPKNGRNRTESQSAPHITSRMYRTRYVGWGLRSSGMLRNVGWQIVTDGSGRPVGLIFTYWKPADARLVKIFPTCYGSRSCNIHNSSPATIQGQTNPKFSPRTSYLRPTLILSSCLRLGITRGLFPSQLPTKTFVHFSPVPRVTGCALVDGYPGSADVSLRHRVPNIRNKRRNDTERST